MAPALAAPVWICHVTFIKRPFLLSLVQESAQAHNMLVALSALVRILQGL